jgi:hypothetical protein
VRCGYLKDDAREWLELDPPTQELSTDGVCWTVITIAPARAAAELIPAPNVLEQLRRQVDGLESWQCDDPLSAFIGEELVSKADVLKVLGGRARA